MPSLNPRAEQLAHFIEAMPSGVPITMLNLLRFNQQAQYPASSEHSPCTGRQAYARYSRIAVARVQAAGGAVEFAAQAHAALIAPADEQWDELLLVRYPSKEAFLDMIGDEHYLAAAEHRTAALADSRLIGTTAR